MDIQVKKPVSIEALQAELTQKFPEYTYFVRKTFVGSMLIVKQSSFIGSGIRLMKDNSVIKVFPAFPALWVQALFGGLLIYAFVYSSMKKLEQKIGGHLTQTYGQ
ncbi:MAG: hypothetical protein HY565_02985 [Candidatus Kerfeldbacteria bacterium]|nr:hypothetical protein [Candidatus Kerfeldbacteria bacterium]